MSQPDCSVSLTRLTTRDVALLFCSHIFAEIRQHSGGEIRLSSAYVRYLSSDGKAGNERGHKLEQGWLAPQMRQPGLCKNRRKLRLSLLARELNNFCSSAALKPGSSDGETAPPSYGKPIEAGKLRLKGQGATPGG